MWDTSIQKIPENIETEDFFLSFFEKGGAKMNPSALYGRISSITVVTDLSNSAYRDILFECQPHEVAINGTPQASSSLGGDESIGLLIGLAVIVLLAVAILFCCCQSTESVASTGTRIPESSSVYTPTSKTPTKARRESSTDEDTPRRFVNCG
jgi:hypothetical protein